MRDNLKKYKYQIWTLIAPNNYQKYKHSFTTVLALYKSKYKERILQTNKNIFRLTKMKIHCTLIKRKIHCTLFHNTHMPKCYKHSQTKITPENWSLTEYLNRVSNNKSSLSSPRLKGKYFSCQIFKPHSN